MKKFPHRFSRLKYLSIRRVLLVVLPLWCLWGLIDVNNWQKAPLRDTDDFTPYQDPAGTVARLSDEEMQPFLFQGKAVMKSVINGLNKTGGYDDYISAIKNFPTVLDCLQKSEWKEPNPDLTKIDWDRIDNNEEAEVCLFRIASSYEDSPKAMMKWFNITLEDPNPTISDLGVPDVSPPPLHITSVNSGWSYEKHMSMVYYPNWILDQLDKILSNGLSFRVFYDPVGNVFEVEVSHNTIL